MPLASEIAHQLGLLPLAWLTALWSAGRRPCPRWWGLAAAFAVSWAADWAAHAVPAFVVGPAYVAFQTGLLVWLLAPPPWGARFLVVLTVTAVSTMLRGAPGPDVLVHTIAWGGLVGLLCWPPGLGRLRLCLAVAFGLGLLAWWGYVLAPGWPSWLTFQGVRAVSVGLFCWAALPHAAGRVAHVA